MKRPGDVAVRCTILLLLDYQPLQFKLDQRLARLLGVHTQTRCLDITWFSCLWVKNLKIAETMVLNIIYIQCNPLFRPVIISALWQYIKTHKLQDQHEKEFVNCDPFLKQIFQVVNKIGYSNLCGTIWCSNINNAEMKQVLFRRTG